MTQTPLFRSRPNEKQAALDYVLWALRKGPLKDEPLELFVKKTVPVDDTASGYALAYNGIYTVEKWVPYEEEGGVKK